MSLSDQTPPPRSPRAEHFFSFDATEDIDRVIKKGVYNTFKECVKCYGTDVATTRDEIMDALEKLANLQHNYPNPPKDAWYTSNAEFKNRFDDACSLVQTNAVDAHIFEGVFFIFEKAEDTLGEMKNIFPTKKAFFKKLFEMWMAIDVEELKASLKKGGDRGLYSKWMDESWFDDLKEDWPMLDV